MSRLVGDDHGARALVVVRAPAPPIGDDAAGFLDQQDSRGGIDKSRFLEIAGEPPHGDIGTTVGRAADNADGSYRRADGIEPLIGTGIELLSGCRKAGADIEKAGIGLCADLQALAIEKGALPPGSGEHLVGGWIVKDTT